METLTLNVRVDANDKKSFEQFCSSVGMNVSTAVNLFIKAVLREQRLPFEIQATNYDNYIREKLQEAEEELNNGTRRYSKEEILKSVNDILG